MTEIIKKEILVDAPFIKCDICFKECEKSIREKEGIFQCPICGNHMCKSTCSGSIFWDYDPVLGYVLEDICKSCYEIGLAEGLIISLSQKVNDYKSAYKKYCIPIQEEFDKIQKMLVKKCLK